MSTYALRPSVSTSLLWMTVPCSVSVMTVVVVLLLDSNNNNNHNNSYRIGHDGKKLLRVSFTILGICVLLRLFTALTSTGAASLCVTCMLNLQAATHLNYEVCVRTVVNCPSR